ncbi:hypothetical protein Agabi119p4_9533 [Agaricus bisporus var. burnettii]|uniref:Cyclin N-terminal domain-containing protein n=1 Tax=Agaricus bisporus var. burnettii TaxID=192524 RepID=A0A8H7C3Y3_AGABI|nr:hypothetical protein Agabi119p4_9533 [Agaricus bisporus var. burnettii]
MLSADEYDEERRDYMRDLESFTMPSAEAMDRQPELKWHMRAYIIDFLLKAHFESSLLPETLYLAVNIMDRYTSLCVVPKRHCRLLACTSLWIAAKFEDGLDRIMIDELLHAANNEFEKRALSQMEYHILSVLQWRVDHPTAVAWLHILSNGACGEDPLRVQNVSHFIMAATLYTREFLNFPPSTIALAAVTLARHICGMPRRLWQQTDECLEVIHYLDARLKQCNGLSKALVNAYSGKMYSAASKVVLDFYSGGGRFYRPPFPIPLKIQRRTAGLLTGVALREGVSINFYESSDTE